MNMLTNHEYAYGQTKSGFRFWKRRYELCAPSQSTPGQICERLLWISIATYLKCLPLSRKAIFGVNSLVTRKEVQRHSVYDDLITYVSTSLSPQVQDRVTQGSPEHRMSQSLGLSGPDPNLHPGLGRVSHSSKWHLSRHAIPSLIKLLHTRYVVETCCLAVKNPSNSDVESNWQMDCKRHDGINHQVYMDLVQPAMFCCQFL